MARNIGATLSLKDGNFFTNMKKAVTSADGLKTTLSGMQKGISSFSGSFKKAAGVVVGAVGAISTAAAGAAGYAVSIGSEYQTALSSIGAQTGAADAELDAFGETMKDIYAEGYGENFEDIAESLSTVAKSAKGLDPSSIKEMTTNAMALRDTFGYDVQESVRAANMLMDQFGISGTQAFNLITQGAQQGLDKNGDLLDSINEYSVHFKQLGIDAEGMFNSLINGTESGTFSVDKLGDAVKEFGIRVKDGTGDDAFKTLGLSVDATKQAFAEGGAAAQQAFKDVNTALFSMDDKVQQNIIGVQLYGTMWEDLGAEGVKALTDISGQADMAKSSMEQLKDVKYDNLGSALEGIKRMFTTNILLPISQEIMPAVNDFVQGIGSAFSDGKLTAAITESVSGLSGALSEAAVKALPVVVDALTTIMDTAAKVITFMTDHWSTLQPIILGVAGAFTAFNAMSGISSFLGAFSGAGKTISSVTKAVQGLSKVSGFKGVLTGLQGVGKAITGVGSAIKGVGPVSKLVSGAVKGVGTAFTFITSPVGLVVAGIAAAIAIGVALYKNWDKIKETATNLWNGVKTAFEGIKNTVADKFSAVKDTIGGVMDTAKSVVQEKLSNIKSAYEDNGGGLKGIAAAAMEGVKGYYTAGYDFINNLTGGKLGQVVETVKGKLAPMVNAVKDKLSGIKDTFGSAFNNAINFVKTSYNEGSLKPVVDKLVSAFGSVKNAIAEKFNGIKEAVGEKLTAVGDAAVGIKDAVVERFTTIKDAIVPKFIEVKNGVQTALTPVVSVVTTIVDGVRNVVTVVIDGIKTHITNSFNIIKTTIVNIVEGIKQNFQIFFTNVKTIFENIKTAVTGIFEGVKTVISGVIQTIVGIFTLNFDTIKSGAQTVMSGITGIIDNAKNVIVGIWDAIKSSAELAFNNVKTVVSNVVDGIKSIVSSIKDTFSNVFNSVKTTVSNVFNSIKTTISNVWNGIKSLIKTPHIVQKGTVSIAGIDTPIPKLGIEWYAKGGIMTEPTTFGINGGNAMVGGESGPEAVLPLDVLWRQLAQFADRLTGAAPTPSPAAVTNNIYVTIPAGTGRESDTELANKVARRIIEVLDNM